MLTVGKVLESQGMFIGQGNSLRCWVKWNGVVVCEFYDYGDGAGGRVRVTNDAVWLEMTKAIPFQLETQIKVAIADQLRAQKMRFAVAHGFVVFVPSGETKYQTANTGSGHGDVSPGRGAVMTILRRNYPGVKFYVQDEATKDWSWVE